MAYFSMSRPSKPSAYEVEGAGRRARARELKPSLRAVRSGERLLASEASK